MEIISSKNREYFKFKNQTVIVPRVSIDKEIQNKNKKNSLSFVSSLFNFAKDLIKINCYTNENTNTFIRGRQENVNERNFYSKYSEEKEDKYLDEIVIPVMPFSWDKVKLTNQEKHLMDDYFERYKELYRMNVNLIYLVGSSRNKLEDLLNLQDNYEKIDGRISEDDFIKPLKDNDYNILIREYGLEELNNMENYGIHDNKLKLARYAFENGSKFALIYNNRHIFKQIFENMYQKLKDY